MRIETLDHVALWVEDRDSLADFLTGRFPMHVIERTDEFTLVGAEARRGKLTLFAAEGPRERGVLSRIGIRVPSDSSAESLTAPSAVPLALVPSDDGVAYDLDHVAFRVPEPEQAFTELSGLGFRPDDGRLRVGDAYVVLEPGEREETDRPLLNHLGLRVESADEQLEEARRRNLDVVDVVDAPNTYAVFILGPGGIKLEYVEHKASFSLT